MFLDSHAALAVRYYGGSDMVNFRILAVFSGDLHAVRAQPRAMRAQTGRGHPPRQPASPSTIASAGADFGLTTAISLCDADCRNILTGDGRGHECLVRPIRTHLLSWYRY